MNMLLVPFLFAMLFVFWIHPKLVRISLDKNIVDNPNSRKLQRKPIPVLGGVGVFFGIVAGIAAASFSIDCSALFVAVVAMIVMLYTGTTDDILDLSPWLRLAVEVSVALLLIYAGGYVIDDFHGLWGIGRLPDYAAVPLTVISMVGIINALNMIDGVDGLSSGLCIAASAMFGMMFYHVGDVPMAVLSAAVTGALIPFFLHNVFGSSSKMFIGDGGTYVMGVVMCVFVGRVLHNGSVCSEWSDSPSGLIAFALAVLSIPVFDTVRVMLMRIARGHSPFHPDKTHLHHLFIDMGFSHAATMLCIVLLDMSVVLCWWVMHRFSVSGDIRLYVVVGLGLAFTFLFYMYARMSQMRNTWFYRMMCRIGELSRMEKCQVFGRIRTVVDRF
ncbi:MAG: undecaprenyl/decaprenyl-phosphate alpha-N-acetylglucosaminyl 1-phosphate transferase [Alistipes sp.]|nr:undecaprenyl/decaprenyl-phosphate alpha-N-acetylglucosaminyl 1-phosphate transferase [Alistipes sp.]